MTSRDSEARRSMGPPVSSKVGIEANSMKQRGPNPQTDYKRHFNRTKERFDVVNTDQASRKKELDRASLKQAKLQEELEYLLDAIAAEQQQVSKVRQAVERTQSPVEERYSRQTEEAQLLGEEEEESQVEETGNNPKRQRPSPADTEDELLETAGVPTKRFRED